MKKTYTPRIPVTQKYNCISRAEKEVLKLKKMGMGKSEYEAEKELRKENAFIITEELKRKEEKKKYEKEHKTEKARENILELFAQANAEKRRRQNG